MNRLRGEVSLTIDGKPRRLCLTLGALAEIETGFGCQSLSELQARLRRVSASELVVVLAALLRGGGEGGCADTVTELGIDAGEAARAVAEAFHAALG